MLNKIVYYCDKIIEYCFYVLIAAVTFSTSLVEIFSSIMISAWLVKIIIKRDFSFTSNISMKVLFFYIGWVFLSCFNSEYFSESFRGIFKVLEYSTIFIIAATSLNGKNIVDRFVNIMAATSIVICIDGIYQYFSGTDFIRGRELMVNDYMHRISSSFIHPNDFGVYLVVVSLIMISILLIKKTEIRNKILPAISLGLIMTCLFLTQSRGSWLSFSAAFIVLGALKARKMLAIFLAILLVIFIMLPYTAQERMLNVANFSTGTTWERLMLWKGTMNMIKVHPIIGFGINTYSRNFPNYKPPQYWDARYSHNCYLHMASEIGVIGALLFLIFLTTVFVCCFMKLSEVRPAKRKALAAALVSGLVGFSMNCIVDTHLYSVNLAVLFHLLLGFSFFLTCYTKNE